MFHISMTITRRATLLAALAAPLSCAAGTVEDVASSSVLAVAAAPVATPCASTTVVDGNVSIATPGDAVAYRCVSVIRGNLSVLSAPGTLYGDVDLSNLEAVHGDVLLAYAPRIDDPSVLREIRLGKLASIVRDPPVSVEARAQPASAVAAAWRPRAPRAPYVRGGRFVVSIDLGTTVVGDVAFALQELSRIDSDVSIEIKGNSPVSGTPTGGGPARITSGLTKLTTVHGDLRIVASSSSNGWDPNRTLPPFLSKLQTVEGSVAFRPSKENQWGYELLALTTIGGDLVITPSSGGAWIGPPYGVFERVSTVGGAIRVTNQDGFARFSASARSLSITDGPLASIDGTPTLGELRIERNPRLRFFHLEGRVLGSGAIVIRDNASLSQCDVDAFLARQRSLGWTGIATTSGNLPGSVDGQPCP
jgi:hypothetical protein